MPLPDHIGYADLYEVAPTSAIDRSGVRPLNEWMQIVENLENRSITAFGEVGNGEPADAAFAAAAQYCRDNPGAAIHVPPGEYPIITGNINAMRATFVGSGGKVITPTNGGAPWETVGGASIQPMSTTNPAFLLGRDATFRGLNFWWPGQVGGPDEISSSVTAYPALFAPLSSDYMSRIVIDNCAAINPYRFIDIGSSSKPAGNIDIRNCSIFPINRLARFLGSCPEIIRFSNNFISHGIVETIIADDPTMANDYFANSIILEVDCGAGTGAASVDGLIWDHSNFVFGARTFLKVVTGTMQLCSFSGVFDGVAKILDWASTGGHHSNTWDGIEVYSYVRTNPGTINTAAADTVFMARNSNSASHFNFDNIRVNYAQGDVFDMATAAAKVSLTNSRIYTHGQSTTNASYYAFKDGASVVRAVIRGNDFAAITNVAATQNGVAVGGSPLVDLSDNDFNNQSTPIVTQSSGGVITIKNNKTTNTRAVTSVFIGGSPTVIGHNVENTFDKPLAALGQYIILPDANSDAASTIPAGVNSVIIAAITTNANDWLVLPTIASVGVGWKIKGWSAVAHEMRTPASSNATINNVDADGTNEAAIPATSYWEVESVISTGWLLRAWTNLGAPITAIVPHV
jgi:hypothetical protein